jgi:hypothetical protein
VLQSAGKNAEAKAKAEEYMRSKSMTCTDEDVQGFCGRYNGIKMSIQMEKEAASQPQEEKKEAKDAEKSNIFTDAPAEGGEEVPPPAEGTPPAEGEAPPAEGETPPEAKEPPK